MNQETSAILYTHLDSLVTAIEILPFEYCDGVRLINYMFKVSDRKLEQGAKHVQN